MALEKPRGNSLGGVQGKDEGHQGQEGQCAWVGLRIGGAEKHALGAKGNKGHILGFCITALQVQDDLGPDYM